MPTPGKLVILSQLHSLRHTGFDVRLKNAAQANGLPVAYFYAIASRETNCHNILGDFTGGQYHGVGIVQIDIQHTLARQMRDDGTYKTNPQPLIDFGAAMLKQNIDAAAQRFPEYTESQHMKIAASGYNCGIGTAIHSAENGDSDLHTTGHDYGRDVMSRTAIFEELFAEGH